MKRFSRWMRLALVAFVLACGAGTARAQMNLGEHSVFSTRFGQVSVVGGDVDNFIYFNGTTYDDIYGQRLFINGGFALGETQEDWLLITRFTGGNGCFPVHILLHVTPRGLTPSPAFGHCVAEPLDIRVAPGRVAVDLSHPDVTIARQTFVFDGVELTSAESTVPITSPPAGAGAEVTRWLGRHPAGIFDDLSERARFATIMPEGEISALANHVSVANSTFQAGDWVIGQGCLPHQCDVSRGVWGLRISDGAVGAAILGPNGFGTLYGLALNDPTLRQIVDAHRPR
jgi:hypothetical protein